MDQQGKRIRYKASRSLWSLFTYRSFADDRRCRISWHQINTRKFSSIAHYVTHVLLRLPRGTVFARYMRLLVASTSSGIRHWITNLASGHKSGAISSFLAQVVGIELEDFATSFCEILIPKRLKLPRCAAQVVGLLWVALYLT